MVDPRAASRAEALTFDMVGSSLERALVASCAGTIGLQASQHPHGVLICRLAEFTDCGRAGGTVLRFPAVALGPALLPRRGPQLRGIFATSLRLPSELSIPFSAALSDRSSQILKRHAGQISALGALQRDQTGLGPKRINPQDFSHCVAFAPLALERKAAPALFPALVITGDGHRFGPSARALDKASENELAIGTWVQARTAHQVFKIAFR